MACITPAAVAHETACSEERPPKTIATRGLRWAGWSVFIAAERIRAGPRAAAATHGRATYAGGVTDETLAPATRAVALGRQTRSPGAGVNAPLELSSTYIADGPVNYARAGNPTWTAFEEALGSLEGGEALVFASGMAAVSAALSLLPPGGVVVVPHHSYNGTT